MENLNGNKIKRVKATYGTITIYDDVGNPYYLDYPELLDLIRRNEFEIDEVRKRKWLRLKILGL